MHQTLSKSSNMPGVAFTRHVAGNQLLLQSRASDPRTVHHFWATGLLWQWIFLLCAEGNTPDVEPGNLFPSALLCHADGLYKDLPKKEPSVHSLGHAFMCGGQVQGRIFGSPPPYYSMSDQSNSELPSPAATRPTTSGHHPPAPANTGELRVAVFHSSSGKCRHRMSAKYRLVASNRHKLSVTHCRPLTTSWGSANGGSTGLCVLRLHVCCCTGLPQFFFFLFQKQSRWAGCACVRACVRPCACTGTFKIAHDEVVPPPPPSLRPSLPSHLPHFPPRVPTSLLGIQISCCPRVFVENRDNGHGSCQMSDIEQ